MNYFSFKSKLILLCAFMSCITTLVSVASFVGLRSVSRSYERVASEALPNLENLNDLFLSYRSIRINLRSLGLSGLSKDQAQEYVKQVREQIEKYDGVNKIYSSGHFDPEEKNLYEEVNKAWLHFKGIGVKALSLYADGSSDALKHLNGIFLIDCPAAAKNYDLAIDKLKMFHTHFAKKSINDAQVASQKTNNFMLFATLLGVVFGLVVGFLFASSITRSISDVAKNLSDTADFVTTASTQIAGSSQALSQATTAQSASLQETAASLEEIAAMIGKASESAKATAQSSLESQGKAEEGKTAVGQMLSSMSEISQSNDTILAQVHESNRQMHEIVNVIRDIGIQTKVINDIVFQTKLLSFNASVEAARAGENGKGFSVVAEEVGNLAAMSGKAAKEITDMLESSTSKVEKIVNETKLKVEGLVSVGKQKVESGVSVAQKCSQVLNEIVEIVSRVSRFSQDISQASQEQSQGVSEINKAMAQLDSVTQKNSSSSGEASTSAQSLASQAVSLKTAVNQLLTVIHGQGHRSVESLSVSSSSANPDLRIASGS